MIIPEQIKVEIKDDGQALNPLHGRAWIPGEARSEIPRSKLSNDMAVRAKQLQDIDLQLRMSVLRMVYGEVWKAGVDISRKLLEFQAGLTLTAEQQTEMNKLVGICGWLARIGIAGPPASNGAEPPRIVRPGEK